METINIEGVGIEEIENGNHAPRHPFPAITISENYIYFNGHLSKHLYAFKYFNLATSSEYVIFTPTNERGKSSFVMNMQGRRAIQASMPKGLLEKKVAFGTYKVYKAKNSFVIKRYEPLEGSET